MLLFGAADLIIDNGAETARDLVDVFAADYTGAKDSSRGARPAVRRPSVL